MRPSNRPLKAAIILCALATGAAGWAERALTWHESFEAAQAAAAASGRPIMVVFRGEGCGPCEEFENETLTDPVVTDLASRFQSVHVDAFVKREIATRYLVSSFPSVKFLAADGTVVHDAEGLLSPERFVQVMQRALDAHAALLRAREAVAETDDRPSAHVALAVARDFALARQHADAVAWAARALEAADQGAADLQAEALLVRGTSLVEIGEPYDAIEALMAYLQIAPWGDGVWRARVALGYAWVQTGENQAGAQLLQAVVDAGDAPISARAEAERLLYWAGAEAN